MGYFYDGGPHLGLGVDDGHAHLADGDPHNVGEAPVRGLL